MSKQFTVTWKNVDDSGSYAWDKGEDDEYWESTDREYNFSSLNSAIDYLLNNKSPFGKDEYEVDIQENGVEKPLFHFESTIRKTCKLNYSLTKEESDLINNETIREHGSLIITCVCTDTENVDRRIDLTIYPGKKTEKLYDYVVFKRNLISEVMAFKDKLK